MEVVAEWFAEAIVAVGEGLGFAGQDVAAAFVPGDQGVADVQDGHADAAAAALLCEVFRGGQEFAA